MTSKYMIDPNHEKFINDFKIKSNIDFENLKKDKINNTDNYISIFINFSQNSNSYSNFLKDKEKFIGKNIKIFLLRKDGIIEELLGPLYVDNEKINIIYLGIGNMKFDYYTSYMESINEYININSTKNYLIYY
jgi:hypothetical protein